VDGNVPLAHAEFVARTVPKAELLALEDCGHLIWVGPGAKQAHDKVVAFLNRHAPQGRPNQGDTPRSVTSLKRS
jgi:pimeloyl-ACP methyl ester carboxylesterase